MYALPGTNHAITNEPSNDSLRQQQYVQTVINNMATSHTDTGAYCLPVNATAALDPNLRSKPHCFIADTDSIGCILDTGANRVIVNNAKLFKSFKPQKGTVLGVGGPVTVIGTGTAILPLTSESGTVDKIEFHDAVYVPTSPYCLFPSQLLYNRLKTQGYKPHWAKHDDKRYKYTYTTPGEQTTKTWTVDTNTNDLFSFQINVGYKAFFTESSNKSTNHDKEWQSFNGAHVIPDTDDDGYDYPREPDRRHTPDNPREPNPGQTHDKPRELPPETSNGNPREPSSAHPIPYQATDFEPIKHDAVDTPFDLEGAHERVDSPETIVYKRKQQRLATIQKKLGHLSFGKLKLMARCHLIPHKLAGVDAPVCPGCAYGKAHRKPWRHKGIRNQKTLRKATSPGQIVSIDQLVSRTPGFIPTHRGIPTTKRYCGATIFVDHFSNFTYTHLMSGTSMNAEETVEAKLAFERIASSHGVTIQGYHANNGLFDTKVFKAAIATAKQSLMFCGPYAHH
jgi:hypothetical protein